MIKYETYIEAPDGGGTRSVASVLLSPFPDKATVSKLLIFMKYEYIFMTTLGINTFGVSIMSNLQIKGIDDQLYQELKRLATDENRSVSQEVLFLIRNHLAQSRRSSKAVTAGQTLLALAGSWEDQRPAEEIVQDIRRRRRSSRKFSEGL
ncbi:MAG: hypothetical protein K9L59_20200 [Desulfobacterales bacterium]|nr:hypothetical protein [Desulfobacterales bacterium]